LVVRKPRPPVRSKSGRGSSPGKKSGSGESPGHPVYSLEKQNVIYCHDFRKMVPVQPEDKERILSLMREHNWALNYVLKDLGKRELAVNVATYGIPRDLYNELFSTLIGYGVPDWIIKGVLSEATKIVKQWYNSTFQKGHVPKAKALRLYVPTAWYNPKTGYLELLPADLKLREVGGNWKCNKNPATGWARLIYRPEYDAFFLELVKEVKAPPNKECHKRALAVDINLNEIVVGNTDKYLERRYPTAFKELEPYRRLLERLREKYPRQGSYDPLERRRGLRRRVWLTKKKMSKIDRHYMKEIAKEIVDYARTLGYCIILENLRGLRERVKEESEKPREVKAKISVMAYSRLAKWIIILAKLNGVPYVFVDPRGTSTTCPRCGAKMVQVEDPVIGKRTMYCPKCGLKEDRDTVALINLVKRFLASSLKHR
jgi:putative transposase